MKRLDKSGFMKIVSAAIIVTASMFFLTCDEKKDNNSSNLLLMLLGGGSSKLVLYNAGTHDGNLKGTEADARTGADAICNASGNKPSGASNVHAFISISGTDDIASMPANYGYAIDDSIYGPDGTSLIANNWADMLDDSINMTLSAVGVISSSSNWTSGSVQDGSYYYGYNECTGFTESLHASQYQTGSSDVTDMFWLTAMAEYCDVGHYILCVGEK